MDSAEKVVRHLEMIQAVINRLGNNSFLLKGWSMTIIVTAMVLIARHDIQHPYLILSLIIPILVFWILDGYFLWKERVFREIYDDIRRQSDTDFKMDVMNHKNTPKCSWGSATFSDTLVIFYLAEVALTVFVFFIIPVGTL